MLTCVSMVTRRSPRIISARREGGDYVFSASSPLGVHVVALLPHWLFLTEISSRLSPSLNSVLRFALNRLPSLLTLQITSLKPLNKYDWSVSCVTLVNKTSAIRWSKLSPTELEPPPRLCVTSAGQMDTLVVPFNFSISSFISWQKGLFHRPPAATRDSSDGTLLKNTINPVKRVNRKDVFTILLPSWS